RTTSSALVPASGYSTSTQPTPTAAPTSCMRIERRRGGRHDTGEGVGEDPPDRDGGVGEGCRAGEPVGRADVGADRGRRENPAVRACQREDKDQQPRSRDDLTDQVPAAGPVGRRDTGWNV